MFPFARPKVGLCWAERVVFWIQVVMGLALVQLMVDKHIPRANSLLICSVFLPTMILARGTVLALCRALQQEGRKRRHLVIAGTGETAQGHGRSN